MARPKKVVQKTKVADVVDKADDVRIPRGRPPKTTIKIINNTKNKLYLEQFVIESSVINKDGSIQKEGFVEVDKKFQESRQVKRALELRLIRMG